MALSTDVVRYEKGKELEKGKKSANGYIDSLSVVVTGLGNMKTELESNAIFAADDVAEVEAAITGIKNKIRTDILGE